MDPPLLTSPAVYNTLEWPFVTKTFVLYIRTTFVNNSQLVITNQDEECHSPRGFRRLLRGLEVSRLRLRQLLPCPGQGWSEAGGRVFLLLLAPWS